MAAVTSPQPALPPPGPQRSPNRGSPKSKSPAEMAALAALPRRARQRCASCSDGAVALLDLGLAVTPDGSVANIPDVIVTRRTRTDSVCGRILDDVQIGTVKYFCRSRGHGFITPDEAPGEELFMHISDIEGEFVPRRGDRVSFRACPIPPRFEKFQAVHVHIINFTPEVHHRWEMPETPEELEEDKQIHSLPYDV